MQQKGQAAELQGKGKVVSWARYVIGIFQTRSLAMWLSNVSHVDVTTEVMRFLSFLFESPYQTCFLNIYPTLTPSLTTMSGAARSICVYLTRL